MINQALLKNTAVFDVEYISACFVRSLGPGRARFGHKVFITDVSLEAQLPVYWVPVLKSLYSFILSVTQGATIWVPGLLG